MALKDGVRRRSSKRFEVDCNPNFEEINFSSDSETEVFDKRDKVRHGLSIKRLLKENKRFAVDKDHIYTSVKSPGVTANESIGKRKITQEINKKSAKKKCFSKNAIMARLNRERKKKYILSLEVENESLRKENSDIKRISENQNKKISVMKREILYLRGLLANSKELGSILTNLKETTGLPVTSSMILTNERDTENGILENSFDNEQDNRNPVEYQPRIKSVNSSCSFPILDKDVNLCSFSNNSSDDLADLENCPFDFKSDSFDTSAAFLNDENSFYNISSKNLDSEAEDYSKFDDLSNKGNPQVGICLHVNQKRIYVEICSICNGKAGSVLEELPDEVCSV